MRTKSKYREIKPAAENKSPEIPAENIPEIKINGEEIQPSVAASVEAGPDVEPDAVAQPVKEQVAADEASAALQKALSAIRQGEELQRQQAAQAIAQNIPTTRKGKLALWKSQGASEAELSFLEANPELIDIPQLTAFAANEAAKQGHERNTEAHMEKTKAIFHEHLARMKEEAGEAEEADRPAMQQPPPTFFRPPPAAKPPAPPSVASYVSAPVSREVPTGGPRELAPGKVTLTQDELEIAKNSGLSPTEYAKGKLRLQAELRAGLRQNG